MVKPIVTIDGATDMAQDIRPFRNGAIALLLLAAAILAAGIWAQLRGSGTDPFSRMLIDVVLPGLENVRPAFIPASNTAFGTFANLAGVIGLAGLLLFTLRRPAPAAPQPVVQPMPRVVPRRPAALRAARTAPAAASAPAAPPADVAAAPPATAARFGRRFQRVALMLVGSVLIGVGALWFLGRAALPVPAFTPPGMDVPSFGADVRQIAMIGIGAALGLFAILRIVSRRRAAA